MSGAHDARRPARRDVRRGSWRRSGERAHPDTTPVRVFGVRLRSMRLSLRDVVAVLELLGIDRSHGAVWNWTHTLSDEQRGPPTASPSRVAVDEKQIGVDGEEKWLYAAIDPDRSRCWSSTSTAAAGPTPRRRSCIAPEKHDVSNAEFLVDAGGYLTALFRHVLSGQLDYSDRNHIENWLRTVAMRIDRFRSFWRGSQASARRWLRRYRYRYNRHRSNQASDGRTPAEDVLNRQCRHIHSPNSPASSSVCRATSRKWPAAGVKSPSLCRRL